MIIIHEGVPGSGKSYDAVRKIIDALLRGRTVVTNIDGMNTDKCLEYIAAKTGITRDSLAEKLLFIDNRLVPEFWNHVPIGAMIVIDEAQLYFNSRDFIKTANREFGDWASTHRHHGYDLLLITQRAERIDTSVRSLAEFRYRYRKLNVFGSLVQKSYLIYTHAGEDPKHLSMRKATYDTSIFPCYQSYVGDATEKKIIKLPNLLNHPIFYALAFMVVMVIYFGSKSPLLHGRLINTPTLEASQASPAEPQEAPAPSPVVASQPLEKAPPATAEAEPEGLSPDRLIRLPLDAIIVLKSSGRAVMSSNGHRLYHVARYDLDLMCAWVPAWAIPNGLRDMI